MRIERIEQRQERENRQERQVRKREGVFILFCLFCTYASSVLWINLILTVCSCHVTYAFFRVNLHSIVA